MKKFLSFILGFAILSTSCTKEPGEGGRGIISGQLTADFYCKEDGSLIGNEGLTETRVYISYGTSQNFDDDVRTGLDGNFEFKDLRAGEYTVSAISDCYSCPSETEVVSQVVTIEKGTWEVTMDSLTITKYTNDNCLGAGENGMYEATGFVNAIYIDKYTNDTLGEGPFRDERVYLIYGDGNTHSEDVRTSADGSYLFTELREGSYKAYAYSECEFCVGGTEAQYVSFEVTADAQPTSIPNITVVVLD